MSEGIGGESNEENFQSCENIYARIRAWLPADWFVLFAAAGRHVSPLPGSIRLCSSFIPAYL